MTRTAIRHMLSALAAAALVSAFASSPASAQSPNYNIQMGGGQDMSNAIVPSTSPEQKTPKGLATQKGPTTQNAPYIQPNALLGVFVQPSTTSP